MTSSERKIKNEKLIKSLGISFNEYLPLIEEENEAKIRTPKEIAIRILILTYLNYISEVNDGRSDILEFLKSKKLWDFVSNREKELFQKDNFTSKEKIDISWHAEAIWLLLWTLNQVDKLDIPYKEVSIIDILKRLPKEMKVVDEFIDKATVRTTSEILDMSDFLYRLHWATRNADINKSDKISVNSSIVYERHYAINWVTCLEDDWDEITTDT